MMNFVVDDEGVDDEVEWFWHLQLHIARHEYILQRPPASEKEMNRKIFDANARKFDLLA